jgi:acid ceramidase
MNGAIITRDREGAADVWKLGTNGSEWFMAQTNYDHWAPPLIIDDRITPANRCLNKMGQNNSSFAGLFNVLSSKPVLNKVCAFYSIGFLK